MAIVTISDLSTIPAIAASDVLPIVSVSTNETYKVTKQSLLATVFPYIGTAEITGSLKVSGSSDCHIVGPVNFGIGTPLPSEKLEIYQSISGNDTRVKVAGNAIKMNSGGNEYELGQAAGGSTLYIKDNSTGDATKERLTIDQYGDIRIYKSLAVGTISPSATQGRIDASNDVVAYSTSDSRYKENIKTISNASEKVASLSGVEFDWIVDNEVHGNFGHDVGVIAQEVEKVLPEVVTTRENGVKAVKYEKLVPLLIEAIKDLQNQIEELRQGVRK